MTKLLHKQCTFEPSKGVGGDQETVLEPFEPPTASTDDRSDELNTINLTQKQYDEICRMWPRERAKMDRRDRALMTMRACLVMEEPDRWAGIISVLSRHLTETELACLASTALRSLPAEIAYDVASDALTSYGERVPIFDDCDALSAARLWAQGASQTELKATAMVAVRSLAPRAREGFVEWLRKKQLIGS